MLFVFLCHFGLFVYSIQRLDSPVSKDLANQVRLEKRISLANQTRLEKQVSLANQVSQMVANPSLGNRINPDSQGLANQINLSNQMEVNPSLGNRINLVSQGLAHQVSLDNQVNQMVVNPSRVKTAGLLATSGTVDLKQVMDRIL